MNSISLVSQISILLVLAASLLFQSSVVRSDAALIQKVCNDTPFPATCVSSINSSPKNASTYVPDLGLAMVDALAAKANAAIDTINKLMGTRPDLASGLSNCLNIYSKGILGNYVPLAKKTFSEGVHYQFAINAGNGAAFDTKSCESSFVQGQSPLTATNTDVYETGFVLGAIGRQLLNKLI